MRVAAAAATLQHRYEAGDISYPRTSSRILGAAGVARVAGLYRGALGSVAEPVVIGPRKPHEAVHVLRGELPGFAGVPQHLLSEELRFLDRVARSNVRAAVPVQIERPDTSALPAWARDLPWWRPGPEFPVEARSGADGCDRVVQAELFDFDAEEVAFEALARESLGRPSSIADHAIRAVERGFVGAGGLTTLGEAALADVPPSLTLPGIAHAVEAVIEDDAGEAGEAGPPGDLIERCFAVMPELAPRLRAALKRGEGDGDSKMAPAAEVSKADSDCGLSASDRAYWERRRAEGVVPEVIEDAAAREREPLVAPPERRDALQEPVETDDGAGLAAVAHAPSDESGAAPNDAGGLAMEELPATVSEPDADWTWLSPEAVSVPHEDSDELEFEDDERTSYAPRGPQPW